MTSPLSRGLFPSAVWRSTWARVHVVVEHRPVLTFWERLPASVTARATCSAGVADSGVLRGPGEHDSDDLAGGGDQGPSGVARLDDRSKLIDLLRALAEGAPGRCRGGDGGLHHSGRQRERTVLGVAGSLGAGARRLSCGRQWQGSSGQVRHVQDGDVDGGVEQNHSGREPGFTPVRLDCRPPHPSHDVGVGQYPMWRDDEP